MTVRAWAFGGLSFTLLCGVATALLADPPPATPSSNLPQVTIQAQQEAVTEQARQFVGKVTGSTWANSDDKPLELWRKPICLAVAGLLRPQGEFVFTRVTQIVSEAGASIDKNDCRPNLFVVVTTEPNVFLSAWRKRDRRLFGSASPGLVKKFFDHALPVRVWYNSKEAGEDEDSSTTSSSFSSAAGIGAAGGGGMGGAGSGGMGGAASSAQLQTMLSELPTFRDHYGGTRLSAAAVPDLSSAIIIVDLKQCEGIGWGALADYIAMAALTNIDVDTNFSDVPSILSLFNVPTDKRQTGLTDWDRAYLKALYHTNRMSHLQRVQIREQMASEMGARVTAAQ